MKKSLFAIALAGTIALASCVKTPELVPGIEISAEKEVLVAAEGAIITFEFKSNTAWTAVLDVDGDVASISQESGTKEEGKIKLTIYPMDAESSYRVITLTITPEGEAVAVKFIQHGPFALSESSFDLSREGGSVEFSVYTSLEYKFKASEGLEVSQEGINFSVVAPASKAWSTTPYYVTFSIPAIQDDVLDDNGDPTGETKDHTETVYIYVAGYVEMGYDTDITDYSDTTRYTIATAGDNLLLCNGEKVYAFNKANGTFIEEVKAEGVWAIANDDAGNIVAATGSGAAYSDIPMQLVAIPEGSFADASTYKALNSYANGFYGYGLDNMTVRGNILSGDAVITFCSGGAPQYGGASYIIFFQYKDGVFQGTEGSYTDYVTLTNLAETDIWDSKHIAAICTTTKFDAGVLYSGYDGIYDICYNPGVSGANWVSVDSGYGDWTMAITSMDIVNWNGKDILVAGALSFFSCWYCPSYIFIVDVTNPTAPVYMDSIPYSTDRTVESYTTNHIQAEVDGDNLVIYGVDGDYRTLFKAVLPPIE